EYPRIQASANGESRRQSGLSIALASTNTAAANITAPDAAVTPILPAGISRDAVRGLRASKARSAIRLNPMAANRAEVKAITTHVITRNDTGATREAASTPSSANGRANRVWGSLTKLSHARSGEVPVKV